MASSTPCVRKHILVLISFSCRYCPSLLVALCIIKFVVATAASSRSTASIQSSTTLIEGLVGSQMSVQVTLDGRAFAVKFGPKDSPVSVANTFCTQEMPQAEDYVMKQCMERLANAVQQQQQQGQRDTRKEVEGVGVLAGALNTGSDALKHPFLDAPYNISHFLSYHEPLSYNRGNTPTNTTNTRHDDYARGKRKDRDGGVSPKETLFYSGSQRKYPIH